jgi:putative transcriptional regulator
MTKSNTRATESRPGRKPVAGKNAAPKRARRVRGVKSKATSLGQQILASLKEIHDSLAAGEPPEKRFTVRTYEIHLEPGAYKPERVKATRAMLNLSQPLFAKFLGVNSATVRGWERGARIPAPIACRFLDEINGNPDYWKTRVAQVIRVETQGPTE